MAEREVVLRFKDKDPLPPIVPGEVLRRTPNLQVVTDYKPGLEGQRAGERFFIEPFTSDAEAMLAKAAAVHNIYNFIIRRHPGRFGDFTPCLRADYIPGNVDVLLKGEVKIPELGKDTIPSPDRMEECIAKNPYGAYTFSDELPVNFGVPNPYTRRLRVHQARYLDDVPERIIHSTDTNRWYKVRTAWWTVLFTTIERGLISGEFTDEALIAHIQEFKAKYKREEFFRPNNLTTAEDIAAANALIDRIWEAHGV